MSLAARALDQHPDVDPDARIAIVPHGQGARVAYVDSGVRFAAPAAAGPRAEPVAPRQAAFDPRAAAAARDAVLRSDGADPDKLLAASSPKGPRLEDWTVIKVGDRLRLTGVVMGHPDYPDGTLLQRTSPIKDVVVEGPNATAVETDKGSLYFLGKPSAAMPERVFIGGTELKIDRKHEVMQFSRVEGGYPEKFAVAKFDGMLVEHSRANRDTIERAHAPDPRAEFVYGGPG